MVLYASYVCLLYSCFIENDLIDLEATNPSFLRWFCHTDERYDGIERGGEARRGW
jgi:hypothetical protein